MSNFPKKLYQKGEVATVLTIVTVTLMLIGTIIGSRGTVDDSVRRYLSAQTSCSFDSTVVIRNQSGQILTRAQMGADTWGISNDRESQITPATVFGTNASYSFSTDTLRASDRRSNAEVTLFLPKEWKIESTFCTGQGCPANMPAQKTANPIKGFNIDCGTDIEYGWVVQLTPGGGGGDAPTSTPTPFTPPNRAPSPQPTVGPSATTAPTPPPSSGTPPLKGNRFQKTPGVCKGEFAQINDPNVEKITIGRRGQTPLFTADRTTPVLKSEGGFQIPFYIAFKNHRVVIDYDPRTPANDGKVRVAVFNPGQRTGWYNAQALRGSGSEDLVITLYYFFKKGIIGNQTEVHYYEELTAKGGCEAGPTSTPTPPITESPTATPIPSPTPTAPVNTPTATPTPGSCPKHISYLLDTSSTMFTTRKLQDAVDAIINHSPQTGVEYSLVGFNYDVKPVIHSTDYNGLVSALRSIPHGNGTNLPGAVAQATGTTILLSDGIPSYDNDKCFYGNSIEMTDITNLDRSASGNQRDADGNKLKAVNIDPNDPRSRLNPPSLETCRERPYGWALADTVAAGRGKVIHALEVNSGSGSNPSLLAELGRGGSHRSVTNIDQSISQIIDQLCPGDRTSASDQRTANPAFGGTTVASTFAIANQSTTRVADEIVMQLCENGGNCKNTTQKIDLGPSESVRVPAVFQNLSRNRQYRVSCVVRYSDRTTENCPEQNAIPGTVAKISLTISDRAPLSLTTKVKTRPGDMNDDKSTNAIDYALVIANYGKKGDENIITTDITGDTNFDGTVKADDLSIVLSDLGN